MTKAEMITAILDDMDRKQNDDRRTIEKRWAGWLRSQTKAALEEICINRCITRKPEAVMDPKVKEILEKAAEGIRMAKVALRYNMDEPTMNKHRGTVEGLLMAATILTGSTYDWDEDGIYENHGNEPVVRA